MPIIKEYLDANGRSPFSEWFNDQSAQAAAKVTAHLVRLTGGNLSNVASVGGGVHEKRDQKRAITMAQRYWNDYRMCKRSKTHGID